ncbi:uncharacterized protein LOC62_03G003697 [Vanrija pseudolonga]|uniref:BRCT domain-containing protein n=1 Tax=Vanrija pseudolonga TaxID=143232 RepID=A0AAF1BGT2_9TREE|nr:hypothetical protein LOC62_03G003697 [Vanrija pseudolonga]
MSTRREGWDDTSRNLTGLSDALAKLKVRLPAPGGTDSVRPGIRRVSNTSSSSSSHSNTPTMPDGKPKNLAHRPSLATLSARPVNPTAHNREPGDESFSVGDHSLASLCTSASVGTFLKGVVAFVDVKTAEGDDASGVFVNMLKTCGARVLTRPTESCTHIIYKGGKQSTAVFYRRLPEDKRPFVVGIRWVVRSKETGRRAPEDEHVVNLDEEDIFQIRRKSMQPKSLGAEQPSGHGLSARMSLNVPELSATRHRSLLYAPKISSPLKTGRFLPLEE